MARLKAVAEEWLGEGEYFLVDIREEHGMTEAMEEVSRIVVEIDHQDGVWIDDCAHLSRFLQERFAGELDDYELEVGSAGIGRPLKVARQYFGLIGKEVEVMTGDGRKIKGILKSVEEPKFTVTCKQKRAVEGKKRPQMVETDIVFDMNEIKYTKYVIKFK